MKKWLLPLVLLLSSLSFSQNGRWATTISTTATIGGVQAILKAAPFAQVRICVFTLSTTVPCPTPATTYADNTTGTACSINAQVVLDGTQSCTATTDVNGNFGFWVSPGKYTVQVTGSGLTSQTLYVVVPPDFGGVINITGNAATATALLNTPTLCGVGLTARGIDVSGNAQGCTTNVQIAADLGNTAAAPNVIATHLSAPLPVLQGGTAVTDFSFSGNTHKAATVSGATTNGHTAQWDASGNVVDGGTVTTGSSGKVTVGGIVFQWFSGSNDSSAEQTVTKNFPTAFASNVWNVQVAYNQTVLGSTADDCWYQVQSFSTTQVTLTKQGTGGTCQISFPMILAIGN